MSHKIKKDVVIILGMHRSGTSALSAVVNSCGYDFRENLLPAKADNILGFWEDRELVNINNRLLNGGSNWKKIPPPKHNQHNQELVKEAKEWYEDIQNPIADKLAFKDPRLCRLMDFWLSIIERPRVLLAVRQPEAVAASLQKRDNIHPIYGLALWTVYNYEAVRSIVDHGLECLVVDYNKLVNNPVEETTVIQKFLNADSVMPERIDSTLRHNQNPDEIEIPKLLKGITSKLYHLILSGKLTDSKKLESDYREVLRTYSFIDDFFVSLTLPQPPTLTYLFQMALGLIYRWGKYLKG